MLAGVSVSDGATADAGIVRAAGADALADRLERPLAHRVFDSPEHAAPDERCRNVYSLATPEDIAQFRAAANANG